jgi:hypothetical protein
MLRVVADYIPNTTLLLAVHGVQLPMCVGRLARRATPSQITSIPLPHSRLVGAASGRRRPPRASGYTHGRVVRRAG